MHIKKANVSPDSNLRCSGLLTCWIALLAIAAAISLTTTPVSAAREGIGCPTPKIDGALQDMIDFAECPDLAGCGLVRTDPAQDVCISDPKAEGCIPLIECPSGGQYIQNGSDIVLAVYAYDAASDILYLGIRVPKGQVIGDADGGKTCNDDCAGGNIPDEPGIGANESYIWFLDTDCDGVTDITVEVMDNAVDVIGATATGTDFSASCTGSDLEVAVEGLGLPPIVEFKAFIGFTFDFQGEDITAPLSCPPPDLTIDVECSGPTSLCPGATGDFTATFENTSLVTLDTADLEIPLPSGLEFVEFVDTDNWDDCQFNDPNVECTDTDVPPGATRSVTVRLRAAEDCVGDQDLTASGTGTYNQGENCPKFPDAIDESTCPVACEVLPSLTCSASGPEEVCEGSDYQNMVSAQNTSDDLATITITGPDGFMEVCEDVAPGGMCGPFQDNRTGPAECDGDILDRYIATATNTCGSEMDTCDVVIQCLVPPEAPTCSAEGPEQICEGADYQNTVSATNTTGQTVDITITGPDGFMEVCQDVAPGGVCGPFQDDRTAPAECDGDILDRYIATAATECGSGMDSCDVVIECREAPPAPSCTAEGPEQICEGADYQNTVSVTNTTGETVDIMITGPDGFMEVCEGVAPDGVCGPFQDDRTAPAECDGDILDRYIATATTKCGAGMDTCDVVIECLEPPPAIACSAEGPEQVCEGTDYQNTVSATNTTGETVDITITGPDGFMQVCEDVAPDGVCGPFQDDRTAPDDCTGKEIEDTYTVVARNDCGDSPPGECSVTVFCTDGPCVDLDVTPDPDEICLGDSVMITIVATNCSASTEDITITGPGDFEFTCEDVAPDGTCETEHVMTPEECPGGVLEFVYTADASIDICPGTASDADTARVGCLEPGVQIEKTTDMTEVETGGVYTITLEITNDGESTLDPVQVCDLLPPGVGFDEEQEIGGTCGVGLVAATPMGDYLEVCFEDFSLEPEGTCTIIYDVTCDVDGEQTDTTRVVAWCPPGYPDPELAVADTAFATVTCVPPGEACPRTPGFWTQQCRAEPGEEPHGPVKFSYEDMLEITACVDDRVEIFDWDNDFGGFCYIFANHQGGGAPQAYFQFAALLANTCAGPYDTWNGDIVNLPEGSPVSGDACEEFGETVGEVIDAVDALLVSLGDDAPNSDYSPIIDCLDAINNGRNVPYDPEACHVDDGLEDGASEGSGALFGTQIELNKPTPNPFTQSTRIAYAVNGSGAQVEIAIFDPAGRKIRTLVSGFQAPGRYELSWNGRNDSGRPVSTGVYFYRSQIGSHRDVIRLVYVR